MDLLKAGRGHAISLEPSQRVKFWQLATKNRPVPSVKAVWKLHAPLVHLFFDLTSVTQEVSY